MLSPIDLVAVGQNSAPILAPLAVADHDFPLGEIQVLDAQTKAFEQTEAGAVQ